MKLVSHFAWLNFEASNRTEGQPMSVGGVGSGWVVVPQPAGSFLASPDLEREERWTNFDDSVNAVSFGFVATAILISMFLLMAIFEKFLRARSAPQQPATQTVADIESGHWECNGKLGHPSPKVRTPTPSLDQIIHLTTTQFSFFL